MTPPEVIQAWRKWCSMLHPELPGPGNGDPCWPGYADVYPLYIGAPHEGRWYVRERLPGTRVWRAEEDGSFSLVGYTCNGCGGPIENGRHLTDRACADYPQGARQLIT